MDDVQSGQSRLDNIRLTEGTDKCMTVFEEICTRDKENAAALLNDRYLTFPCLFILLPHIESFRLHGRLSPIKQTATRIAAQILKPASSAHSGYLSNKNNAEYAALTWIVKTGKPEDGLSDDYEEVLDICVSVLINIYKDKSILPDVCDMIFSRDEKGHNIHSLVWAFFRSSDPYAIKLLAQRMASPRDSKLARRLLGTEASAGSDNTKKQMEAYLKWLDDNDPFLYFTDESFQLTSSPVFYRIDLDRKYIQKSASTYAKQPIVPADSNESKRLAVFRSRENEEKRILSDYSHTIHKDLSKWKLWMALPVGEQIKTAMQCCEDV